MKLTKFGELVRIIRLKNSITLKEMASNMEISSSYLSSLEFGEKTLLAKHVDAACSFLNDFCSEEEIQQLRYAAEESKKSLDTSNIKAEDRGLVAAFARRLEMGHQPNQEILNWLYNKTGTKTDDHH